MSQFATQRRLRLAAYLTDHPGVLVSDVAELFGVSEATVLKDLNVLQYVGCDDYLPDRLFECDIDASEEGNRIYFANPDVLHGALRLNTTEATQLVLGLNRLIELGGNPPEAQSALDKLVEALRGRPEIGQPVPVEIHVPAGDPQDHARLREAIEARRVVQLDYRGYSRRSQPVVEPVALTEKAGLPYLEAWSREKEGWRSYRLDRIVSVTVLNESFVPQEPRSVTNSAWFDDAVPSVTITVKPAGAWVSEYHPVSDVQPDGPNTKITLPVASRAWLIGLLLRLADDVVAVDDPELARAAQASAQRALQHYAAGNVKAQ